MKRRLSPWLPKSVVCARGYDVATFRKDVIAGITVGLVALPLAMAFAIASGLTPQAGVACAVVTGFLISAIGGSRVQVGGPTGAFVVVVAGIVAQHGVSGLFICTMMAGVILILLGVTRSGTAVQFIPKPVVVGFTNGIAVIIASTQIPDFLGLSLAGDTSEFFARMQAVVRSMPSTSVWATLVGVSTIATVILTNRHFKHVPGTIVALVAGTAIATFADLPIETIGSRFGAIPASLPPFHVPEFKPSLMLTLLSPALTVAMLGAIESLMSAVVADRMTGDRHNPNVELIAQGVANVVSPMFGGLPATGAIARTATNVRSGAQTPVAGMVHAVTLLVVLLVAAPLAAFIPMAVLAGLLFVVAANMGEWHEIPSLLRQAKADIAIWLVTFGLTVFADLTVAVEVGMVIAALSYIRRVTVTTTVGRVTARYLSEGQPHVLQGKEIPDFVAVYRIHGPFLFGTTDKLNRVLDHLNSLPPIVIFRLRNMTAIDATGLGALEDAAERLRESGRTAIFCGAREQPRVAMERADFAAHVGEENVCPHIDAALARAHAIHQASGLAPKLAV